ncbi:MAG: 2Fe-2S iron-sulfur cluster-binding protein [Pseudobdellovibrionaceae bacterium]
MGPRLSTNTFHFISSLHVLECVSYNKSMPQIFFFKKNRPPINVPAGANLMNALLDENIPVASSCNGDGICAKCKIEILNGAENLSQENETEIFLKEKFNLPKTIRISCQTEIIGDITVDASYW